MAEEEASLPSPEVTTGAQQPKEEGQGNKKLLIIIISAIVLLIIIISSVLIYIFTSAGDNSALKGTEEEAEFVELYNKRMQSSLEPIDKPIFTELYSYSVNMKNGRNFLQVSFRGVLNDPMAKLFLDARKPIIDDRMITLLKQYSPADLKTRAGLELMKQEIFKEMNLLFDQQFIDQSQSKDRTPVKDVLLTEFYIQ